jgi:hypothetical protein
MHRHGPRARGTAGVSRAASKGRGPVCLRGRAERSLTHRSKSTREFARFAGSVEPGRALWFGLRRWFLSPTRFGVADFWPRLSVPAREWMVWFTDRMQIGAYVGLVRNRQPSCPAVPRARGPWRCIAQAVPRTRTGPLPCPRTAGCGWRIEIGAMAESRTRIIGHAKRRSHRGIGPNGLITAHSCSGPEPCVAFCRT